MTCPPIKSQIVKNRLCGLLYYPSTSGGCKFARMCNNIYKRWLAESAEVRELEGVTDEKGCLESKNDLGPRKTI